MKLLNQLATLLRLSPALSPQAESIQLPLIIWHGLGDRFDADGIQAVAALAEKLNPSTYVYRVALSSSGGADRTATFYGNATEQLLIACDAMAAHPVLSTAPAVNALGFSQGGLFLRAYVQRCNSPAVRNLVTFGSPHNGIRDFGCAGGDWLCGGAMGLLRSNAWSGFVQGRVVPAQYYRTLADDGTLRASDEYLAHSNFLADVNGERVRKNATYARNLAMLNRFAMYLFKADTTVRPRESEWFAEINGTSGEVVQLKDRELYLEDWIGLKKLDEKGGIDYRTLEGEHMHFSDEELEAVLKEYFGPVDKEEELDPSSLGSLEL